jgi:hypothetical protein
MKVRFCEKTNDISFVLSKKETVKVKRHEFFTPVLDAKNKGLIFHLMNCSSKHYI